MLLIGHTSELGYGHSLLLSSALLLVIVSAAGLDGGPLSPNSVSLMLALIEHGCIFVPLTKSVKDNRENFIKIAQGEFLFEIDKLSVRSP